jgi:CRP/FNR family cyclic AMP-dependent transcriptional regulator
MIGELGKSYPQGDVIFREGDVGDAMYVIQFGRVRIAKETPAGSVTLATLEPGDIFGEMALFDKEKRSATALADCDCRILTVDKRKFFTSISRDPTLAFKILQSLSQRIRRLDEQVTEMRSQLPSSP